MSVVSIKRKAEALKIPCYSLDIYESLSVYSHMKTFPFLSTNKLAEY